MEYEEIILSCLKNEKKSQRQLYDLLAPKLFGVCMKYTSNYDEAKDFMQESFILIFKNLHQLSNSTNLFAWSKRITINYCIQQLKKKEFLFENNDNLFEIEIEDESIENIKYSPEILLKMIQELPEKYRICFNLYVLDEYSHKEISELLGISEGTSKSNLSRAKKILKEKLIIYNQKNTAL